MTFAIHITWHDAPGVATPLLASTWGLVEFRIRDVPLLFRREPAGHVQRGAFVSAFPLAEWAATNFQDLLGEKPPRMHSFSARVSQRPAAQSWLRRHNLFTCREGMAYPDLSFVPLGDHVGVHWYRGGGFLTRGRVVLSRSAVERTLAKFVDDVCYRTKHVNDRAQDVRELWAATSNTLLRSVLVGPRDR